MRAVSGPTAPPGPPTRDGTYRGHDGATPGYDTVAYSVKGGMHQAVVHVNSITLTDKVGSRKAEEAWPRVVDAAYRGTS